MKPRKSSNKEHSTFINNKNLNNTVKLDIFQNTIVTSNIVNDFKLKNTNVIGCYTFTSHSPSKEYYNNSFKKYYNDTIKIRKKPSAKIEINAKKTLFKPWNTLEDIDFFPSSSINSSNRVIFKSASNAFIDVKVENSYIKLEKKTETSYNKIEKEGSLASHSYTDPEENSENIIKGGKSRDNQRIIYIGIDMLLKKIAYEQVAEFDFDIIEFFIIQFQSFIEFNVLMEKIKSLFILSTKNKFFPRGIIVFLNKLVSCDILNYENLNELNEFYKNIKNYPEALEPELRIHEMIKQLNLLISNSLTNSKCGLYNNFIQQLNKAKNPLIPEISSKYFDVIDWSELEMAKQLSLFTHFIFMKIEMKEFLSSNWTKEEKYKLSPNIMKMIDRFNNLCNWVCEEILSYDCKINRARAVSKFIKIASICRSINNFNDCVNIIASLNTIQIKSLKKTWSIVLKNHEISNIFKELNSFCSYTKNYEKIRNEISSVKGNPCIPYLGLYLKELAFLEEGPKYINNMQLINLEKIQKIGVKLEELKEFQSIPFIYYPITRLSFLADPKPKNEETLIMISSKLEPIFTLHSTKSLKKRPSNTDLLSIELNEVFKEMIREFSRDNLINF